MKQLCLQVAAIFLAFTLSFVSRAANVTGSIFCDANGDGILDTGDIAIPGVRVVITNQTGSFSNSAVSAVDGSFNISIPDFNPVLERLDPLSQVYVEGLAPASLPAGSTIVLPTAITNLTSTPVYFIDFAADFTNLVFTSGTGDTTTGDWLINDPECGASAGNCKLTGNARFAGQENASHMFGGTIVSGNPPKGRWVDVSRMPNERFQSTTVDSVICGTGTIDFSGTGTLGEHRQEGQVLFTAHVENISTGKKKESVTGYYLRVYTADGTTLDLVSADAEDPTNVAPVAVTSGHLRLVTQ